MFHPLVLFLLLLSSLSIPIILPPKPQPQKLKKYPKPKAIFSTGIFHLEHTGVSTVSDLWWVYFLASGLLTILTVGIWIVYMRWRSLAIRKEEEKLEKIL